MPSLVVGSSIGSLIGAAWASAFLSGRWRSEPGPSAGGTSSRWPAPTWHFAAAAPALYRREPLEFLVRSLVGDVTFQDLPAACW